MLFYGKIMLQNKKLGCLIMKKILSVALILCLALTLFAGCTNEKKIVGTWEGKYETGLFGISTDIEYNFKEDGTGSMPVLQTGINIDVNFTYTINEDTLTIVTDSEILSQTIVYTMEFEKDTLTLTDEDGKALVLTKVEE